MSKWVIDWETMKYLLQKFKESENKWKEQHPFGHRIMTADSIEYFVHRAFEEFGFWTEENNNG